MAKERAERNLLSDITGGAYSVKEVAKVIKR